MSCFGKLLALALSAAVGAGALLTNDTKQIVAPQFRVVGQGNCNPERPQWFRCNDADFHTCQQACLSSDQCIGFDYDPTWMCCRVRLSTNTAAKRNVPEGFTTSWVHSEDGDDILGTTGSMTATCYERVKHRRIIQKYGEGTCGSNRPQRHGYLTFPACKQACIANDGCIGFDYDPMQVYCRMRFQKIQDAKTALSGDASGLAELSGNEGPGFIDTYPSNATCYVKTDVPFSEKYDLAVYGSGTCKLERPRWEICTGATFHKCQHTCLNEDGCIGFDFDAADDGCCRIYFSSNIDAPFRLSHSNDPGFVFYQGEEGPGFSGSSGPASSTCYVKPNHPSSTRFDLFIYGPGNCQPERPQWRLGNPGTFGECQQTCLNMKGCMGFDYDPAYGGYCRIYFATNDEASQITEEYTNVGFQMKYGNEGYGFQRSTGQHDSEGATCYVKPGFPGATMQSAAQGRFKSILPAIVAAFGCLAVFSAIVFKIAKAKRGDSITEPLLLDDTPEECNAQNTAA